MFDQETFSRQLGDILRLLTKGCGFGSLVEIGLHCMGHQGLNLLIACPPGDGGAKRELDDVVIFLPEMACIQSVGRA